MSAAVSRRPVRRLLRAAGTRVLAFASKAYVPGPLLADAMSWAHRMDRDGVACTLGYFNADDEAPTAISAHDHAAVDALAAMTATSATPRTAYVSLKVPSLGYDEALLMQLAVAAQRHGQIVHFDSHGPETATPTLEALGRLVGHGCRLSLSVPSRWARSRADAEWAVTHGVRVRVVKGQWACPDKPETDLRSGYLDMVRHLAGRASAVAIATHDASLAREALTLLKAAGTPCELELLCGLPRRESMAVARELKVPVRLYIPFGQAWLPYALDQAVRSPRMMWWMARDTFAAWRGQERGRAHS